MIKMTAAAPRIAYEDLMRFLGMPFSATGPRFISGMARLRWTPA